MIATRTIHLALIVGVALSGLASLMLLHSALHDIAATGRVFSDFQVMLIAAKLAAAGQIQDAYDGATLLAIEKAANPGLTRLIHYNYPPTLALLLQPFLSLAPWIAQMIWTAIGLAVFGAAARALYRRSLGGSAANGRISPWLLSGAILLGFPMAANLASGQNGLLFAGLLGLGLVMSDRRPILAGLCLALLTIKPQYGVLVPIALVAGRQWRTLIAAAGFGTLIGLASLVAFGPAGWLGFVHGLAGSGQRLSDGGFTTMRMGTVFAAVYDGLGQGDTARRLALAAQAALAILAAIGVARSWNRAGAGPETTALLIASLPLTTPYLFDYDLIVMALPAAVLVGRDRAVSPGLGLAYAAGLAAAPWGMVVFAATGERMNAAIASHPLSWACLALTVMLWRACTPIAAIRARSRAGERPIASLAHQ